MIALSSARLRQRPGQRNCPLLPRARGARPSIISSAQKKSLVPVSVKIGRKALCTSRVALLRKDLKVLLPPAMGKAKKPKIKASSSKPYTKLSTTNDKSHSSVRKPTNGAKPPPPTIPFSSTDRILLIGEGDFSFSSSLLSAHGCANLVATSYDKNSELRNKYPQAASNIAALEAEQNCTVKYGVDATKLGKSGVAEGGGGGKEVKKGGFDRVVFNFPHVGGLTKDVNRQVRHNQGKVMGTMPTIRSRPSFSIWLIDVRRTHHWFLQGCATVAGSFRIDRCYNLRRRAVRTLERQRSCTACGLES